MSRGHMVSQEFRSSRALDGLEHMVSQEFQGSGALDGRECATVNHIPPPVWLRVRARIPQLSPKTGRQS